MGKHSLLDKDDIATLQAIWERPEYSPPAPETKPEQSGSWRLRGAARLGAMISAATIALSLQLSGNTPAPETIAPPVSNPVELSPQIVTPGELPGLY
jgi:hypothetical protein